MENMWCMVINIDFTSLESVSFFLFSELPFTGAWWPGSPGTNTLLLALTIGVFTWNRSFTFMTWVRVKAVYRGEPAHTIRLFGLDDGLQETEFELVTLETVVSRERDKLVWTSRVKHTCLSAVLISCKEWAGRRQVNETSNIFLQRRPNLQKVWVLDNKSQSKTENEFKSLHCRRSTELHRLKTSKTKIYKWHNAMYLKTHYFNNTVLVAVHSAVTHEYNLAMSVIQWADCCPGKTAARSVLIV